MTDDLMAWLTAQLDHDQRVAESTRQASPSWQNLDMDGELRDDVNAGTVCIAPEPNTRAHIALHDPARVIREIGAKKAIIADYVETVRIRDKSRAVIDAAGDNPGTQDVAEERWTSIEADALRDVLRRLAAVYADRDGYTEDWGVA